MLELDTDTIELEMKSGHLQTVLGQDVALDKNEEETGGQCGILITLYHPRAISKTVFGQA